MGKLSFGQAAESDIGADSHAVDDNRLYAQNGGAAGSIDPAVLQFGLERLEEAESDAEHEDAGNGKPGASRQRQHKARGCGGEKQGGGSTGYSQFFRYTGRERAAQSGNRRGNVDITYRSIGKSAFRILELTEKNGDSLMGFVQKCDTDEEQKKIFIRQRLFQQKNKITETMRLPLAVHIHKP